MVRIALGHASPPVCVTTALYVTLASFFSGSKRTSYSAVHAADPTTYETRTSTFSSSFDTSSTTTTTCRAATRAAPPRELRSLCVAAISLEISSTRFWATRCAASDDASSAAVVSSIAFHLSGDEKTPSRSSSARSPLRALSAHWRKKAPCATQSARRSSASVRSARSCLSLSASAARSELGAAAATSTLSVLNDTPRSVHVPALASPSAPWRTATCTLSRSRPCGRSAKTTLTSPLGMRSIVATRRTCADDSNTVTSVILEVGRIVVMLGG